jgi:hypothetical protein
MKRLINILFTLPLLMIWGCTDSMDDGATGGRGTMTIQLSGGNLSVATRADQTQDHEFYMGDVQLFFYPGNSQTEAAAFALRNVKVDAYGSKDIVVGLTDDDLAKIFPGSNTTCAVYAVSNVANSSDIANTASIDEIKATAITTAVDDFLGSAWSIPMSGMSTVTLNPTTMTVSGNIEMERSVAKITLDVSIKNKITTDAGETYLFEQDAADVTAYIYNGATTGLIDGMAAADKRNYTRLQDGKAVYTLGYKAAESSPEGSSDYTLRMPFYSYPNEWESESSSNETTLRLKVPWKKSEESEWTTYYYRVPINDVDHKLDRNTHYRIKLNVGMLGSKVPSTPVTLDDFTYEILSWSEDDIDLEQDLSTAQYLVVEENNFTLTNVSDTVIHYNSSAILRAVYLKSVSYYSTNYNDTVYLYDTNNDETYTETSSYSDNSKSVQTKYSTAVSEIKNVKNALGFESDMSGSTYLGSGQINFSANVQNIAAVVYRPVTYTIVLVANDINSRVTVKLTQYPSKYIEYGAGGNVFVNGYFARLAPDSGYDTTSDSWPGTTEQNREGNYRGYSFTNSNYAASSSSTSYTGSYYSSTDEYNQDPSINYGSDNPGAGNMYGVSTSYEVVRGSLENSNTLKVKYTIDVYVSAFSDKDNTFEINSGNSVKKYVIGSSLTDGGFTYDTHSSSDYNYSGNILYDYYVGGKKSTTTSGYGYGQQTTTTYYRYVKSWGDKAEKIKVGGTETKYDNIIAPMFKIQSALGAAASTVYFDVAQKRCATYQEAGYPAGRWRLPTLAEIAYIVKLQNEGVMENMFNPNSSGYWTSSGGRILASSDMTYTENYKNTTVQSWYGNTVPSRCFVRCVYDTWYWGTEQEKPTHQYHPMP